MKRTYNAIILLLSILLLAGCYDEDDINPEKTEARYDISDSSDPVQHYKYEMYKKIGSILITDVNASDFRYNLQYANLYRMIPVEQDQQLLLDGIKFLEKNFISLYPEDFAKEYFPVNIILADSIFNDGYGKENQILSSCSRNFIAIGEIREGIKDITPEKEKEIKGEINARFIQNYLGDVKKLFKIPDDFAEVSAQYYGGSIFDFESRFAPKESIDWYKYGLVSWDPASVMVFPWGAEFYSAPYAEEDLDMWFKFILTTDKTTMDGILEKYPLMKQKYDIINQAIKKGLGKDLTEIYK